VSRARGTVLLLTLVFALLLGLLSAAVASTAGLQFRMAGNGQQREDTLQRVDAVAAELAADPANFDLAVAVGGRRCVGGDTDPACDAHGLGAPAATAGLARGALRYSVLRLAPDLVWGARGARYYALFELAVSMDSGTGRAVEVAVGVAVPEAGGAPVPVYWRDPAVDPL